MGSGKGQTKRVNATSSNLVSSIKTLDELEKETDAYAKSSHADKIDNHAEMKKIYTQINKKSEDFTDFITIKENGINKLIKDCESGKLSIDEKTLNEIIKIESEAITKLYKEYAKINKVLHKAYSQL